MRGLTKQYVLSRFVMWIITIWIGSTVVFHPAMAPGDPITAQSFA